MTMHAEVPTRNGTGAPRQDGPPEEAEQWRSRARVVLTPLAAPSILGLFGFSAATLMVAAHLAGWYGNAFTNLYLWPFAAIFGGVAQFLAGMWAYRARDGLATAMHGMWGSFWIAFGILWGMIAGHVLPLPTGIYMPALGFWFIMLGAITWMGFFASLAENVGLAATLGTLAAGASLLASAYMTGVTWLEHTGGWVLVVSAGCAFYTASAMMLESTVGRTVLPLTKYSKSANKPGGRVTEPIEFPRGMPGVRVGQ